PAPEAAPEPEPIVLAAPVPVDEPQQEPIVEGQQERVVDDAVSEDTVSDEKAMPAPTAALWAQSPEPPSAPLATYAADDAPAKPNRMPLMIMAGIIALLIGTVLWLSSRAPGAPRSGDGELVVQSRPPGANVSIDGSRRGVTPLTVSLKSGAHVLEVQVGKSEPRVIPLTIQANAQTAQYIELQGVQATGSLEIKSEPSGARVMIDGQPRGTTPATIRDLPAGDHSLVLELAGRKVTQAVKIEAGSTARVVVPIPRR
ncbi:MAG: PEGA domain-containing protein, partial [Acidobacteriota bacterium]